MQFFAGLVVGAMMMIGSFWVDGRYETRTIDAPIPACSLRSDDPWLQSRYARAGHRPSNREADQEGIPDLDADSGPRMARKWLWKAD